MSCRGVSAVSVGFGGGMSGGMSVGIALGMSVGMVVGMVVGIDEGITLATAAALLLPNVSVVASQPTTCDTNSSRAQRPKRGARTACMALSVAGPFNRTRDAGLIRPRPRKRRPQT